MKVKYCKTPVHLAGALLVALSATLPARADYQSVVVGQSPAGYWRLNETTAPQPPITTAQNLGSLSATGNGTYGGSQGFFRGFPGALANSDTAVHFDGAGQNVLVPYNAALNPTTFTVEAWLWSDASGTQCPISCGTFSNPRSGWLIYQNGSGGYNFRMYAQAGTATSLDISTTGDNIVGAWVHLAVTWDGTTARMYVNGVEKNTGSPTGYVPGVSGGFTIGRRNDTGFPWAGKADEVAFYNTVLTPTAIQNRYNAASANPAGYQALIQADNPLLYFRLNEAGDPPAANLGTLGISANGTYATGSTPGQPGPRPVVYPGFDAGNNAVAFAGAGSVAIPPLNLNANTVTISAWVKANGAQAKGTAIVRSKGGSTDAGLTIDQVYDGLGLGYIWDGNNYGVSFSSDLLLPQLPDNQWAYVALVIEPAQAAIFVCDQNNYASFSGATNSFNVTHAPEAFDGVTLIGAESGSTTANLNGVVDEVTIFNRALGVGELYTQYATAVGNVPPRLFGALQGPTEAVLAGDPLALIVDAGGTPPLTFTWNKGGSTVATTTSGTLTIPNSALGDSGTYDVTISNAQGSVPGGAVTVSVISPSAPVITKLEGFNDRKLYEGAVLRMAITASGGGLKYTWKKGSTEIAGATSSAYVVASVTPADAGTYSCLVTNTLGQAPAGPVTITIPTVTAGSYESLVLASGPEAWWRLNEAAGSTNLFDAMGRHDGYYTNLNGSLPPVTLGVPGALENNPDTAISFNPATPGVGVIPYSVALNPGKFTVEAWVKTTVTGGSIVPVSSTAGTGGWWWQTTAGYWAGFGPGGYAPLLDYNPAVVIAPGQWTHLVITYDGARTGSDGNLYPYQYFVNGQGDGYIWSGSSANTAGPFIIGGRGTSPLADRLFDGQVDEVAVYGKLLSTSEIANHFQGRFGANTPPYFIGSFISQTVTTGKTIAYSTIVQGSQPIRLQWYKDSAPIAGATNANYTITNTAVADTGLYTLWATNSAGVSSQSASVTVLAPVAYANVTNDLVLHMKFDGNAADSSGRNNNGTESTAPAPTYVPGLIGPQAIQYTTTTNGDPIVVESASYVDLAKPTDLQFGANTSFTIGLWVKYPAGYENGDLPFIGNATNSMNNPGWALGPTYGGGGWQWCLNDGVGNNIGLSGPDGSINNGAWHHFLVSVDRTAKVVSTYLDGVCVAKSDVSALGSVDNNNFWPITIGQDPTRLYPEGGSATLDDLGIWRRALSAADVVSIESAGRTAGRSFDTVNPNPDVVLGITWVGTDIKLSWSQGTLLQSDKLGPDASWSPVSGAAPPSYTFTPGTGNKFYRVQVQ